MINIFVIYNPQFTPSSLGIPTIEGLASIGPLSLSLITTRTQIHEVLANGVTTGNPEAKAHTKIPEFHRSIAYIALRGRWVARWILRPVLNTLTGIFNSHLNYNSTTSRWVIFNFLPPHEGIKKGKGET
jgi:hypothetical protein